MPSLQQLDRPADRIRLHLQASKDAVLIVEGEVDKLVLNDLMPKRVIFPVGSRAIVLQTLSELHVSKACAFIAIIDRDFEEVPSSEATQEHLLTYDGRDLEGMLIALGGLGKLIAFKGSIKKVAGLGGSNALSTDLVARATPITTLRRLSRQHAWGLKFDENPILDRIEPRTLGFNLSSYCLALCRSSSPSVSPSDLVLMVESNTAGHEAPRGRDVLSFASAALRRLAGNLDKASANPDLLSRDLLGFSRHELAESSWMQSLVQRLEEWD